MSELSFVVYGVPQPQGSLRAVAHRKTGKAVLISDRPKLKAWRELVGKEAWARCSGKPLLGGCVQLDVHFWLPKPKRAVHLWPKRDLDKLIRGISDALTGIVYVDDAQITRIIASKDYADKPGAAIRVKALG